VEHGTRDVPSNTDCTLERRNNAQEGHGRAVFRVTPDPPERTHCWRKALEATQGVDGGSGPRSDAPSTLAVS
jgi:hypothetical protein